MYTIYIYSMCHVQYLVNHSSLYVLLSYFISLHPIYKSQESTKEDTLLYQYCSVHFLLEKCLWAFQKGLVSGTKYHGFTATSDVLDILTPFLLTLLLFAGVSVSWRVRWGSVKKLWTSSSCSMCLACTGTL